MKTMENTKKVVFAIGALSVLTGIVELGMKGATLDNFYPLYIGLTLIGSVVFNGSKPIEKTV